MLDGEVDVALVTTAKVPRRLVEEPLFNDEIVFVLAASHPLAQRTAISAEDLRAQTLITSTTTPEPERRWFVKQVFGERRAELKTLRFR